MTIKKKLLLTTISAVVAFAVFWVGRINSLPNSVARLEAEKAVYYLLLIDASYNDNVENIPLAELTTLGQFDEEVSQKTPPLFVDGFPTVKRETFVNLKESNKQSYSIRDYVPSQISERMTRPQGGSISFSRIGFDAFLTQALVVREEYFGCNSNGDCPYGRGSLIFLQKTDGKWAIERELAWWRKEDV